MPNHTIHQGRNLKRFREMLGLKQEGLAWELGEDWNQQKVSLLEQKETIDRHILDQVSAILKIPAEAIQNFDEENAVNVIANTFTNNDSAIGYNRSEIQHFNSIEKYVQLHQEKMDLYERMLKEYEKMLKEKDDMMARLERIISSAK